MEDERIISDLINTITDEEKLSLKELNLIFCNDDYLLKINREFLKRDYLTDIISFYYPDEKAPQSELYISVDRIKENYKQYSKNFNSELLRVIAHGVLHLCGYEDSTTEEENFMRKKESYYIKNFEK